MATSSALRLESHLARLEGRPDDAVELNEQAVAIDVELGHGAMLVIMRQWSVEVLILQGRVGETLTIKRQAVNELEVTESLARQAVSYAYETDLGWAHALVHERSLTSSRPRNAPTRHGKSSARAIEIYESYGNTFEAGRARALVIQL
jgi:hypothetical protein